MHKKVSKKYLNRDTCIYTIATFLFYWLINILFVNLNFLDHDYQSKEDSDINDMVYSKFKRVASANKKNTEIILVNVGNANREEIATLIDSIAIKSPKIIALDISFSSIKETLNTHLVNSLRKNKDKIVLGGHFEYGNSSHLETFLTSDAVYSNQIAIGHTNFVTLYSQGTVRRFSPFVSFKEQLIPSFSAQILKKLDASKYNHLEKRGNSTELINYKYTISAFQVLEAEEILKSQSQIKIKDKIVIFGYISNAKNGHSIEDYHYTPMNENVNFPDMPGVAIHANILNMFLNNSYIGKFPTWITLIFSFIICFSHIWIFMWLSANRPIWVHLQSKIIQFVSVVFIIYACVSIFYFTNYRVETTLIVIPIALSADIRLFGNAIFEWLHIKYKVNSYFFKTESAHKALRK